jgi:hypothetical protein
MLDRLETGGPGQINVPLTREFELGNDLAVGISRDIPDLTFTAESKDVTCDLEALLLNEQNTSGNSPFLIEQCKTVDAASFFAAGLKTATPYDTVASIAVPHLYLESLSYRFGLRDSARQTATLRGDSMIFGSGSMFVEEIAGSGVAGQTYALAHGAYIYNGDTTTGPRYALNVSVNGVTRLRYGLDYTETTTGAGASKTVTLHFTNTYDVADKIRVVYQSDTVAQFPQSSHPSTTVKPAAIRGRDITIFVSPLDGSGAVQSLSGFGVKYTNVQSASVDWRATLDRDEEFGNANVISQDFEIPAVTGSVDIKPQDATEIMTRLRQLSGVATATEGVGPYQQVLVALDIVLHHPDTGTALKTLHVPDARFTLPAVSARVQQKITLSLPFSSDSGALRVYRGQRS